MNKPKVVVVIPAYNEEAQLGACLNILKNQDYDGPFEIIVVNNNSTDGTVELAKSYGVTVINEVEKGVVPARNAGFRVANADIIASTDADTLVPSNWISRGVSHFDRPNVLAVSGPDSYKTTSLIIYYLQIVYMRYLTPLLQTLGIRPHMATFNFFIRKNAFEKAGPFRKSFDEGYDLAMRVKKIGRIKFDRKMVVQTSSRRFDDLGLLPFIVRGFRRFASDKLFKHPEEMNDVRT